MKWIVHQSDRRAFKLFRNRPTFEYDLEMRIHGNMVLNAFTMRITNHTLRWRVTNSKEEKKKCTQPNLESYVFSNICFGLKHRMHVHVCVRDYFEEEEEKKTNNNKVSEEINDIGLKTVRLKNVVFELGASCVSLDLGTWIFLNMDWVIRKCKVPFFSSWTMNRTELKWISVDDAIESIRQ